MVTLADPDGYLFDPAGDPNGYDWEPTQEDLLAGKLAGVPGHLGSRRERDDRLVSYHAWLAAGRPAPWPPEAVLGGVRTKQEAGIRSQIVAFVTGTRVKVQPREPEPAQGPRSAPEPPSAPKSTREPQPAAPPASNAAANRWSAGHGLPRHRKDRPSQLPAGRRARFLRTIAERDSISLAEAAHRHPRRVPKVTEPS